MKDCRTQIWYTIIHIELYDFLHGEKEQLDMYLRFWNKDSRSVKTRFYSSIMLGHTKATNLHEAINEVTFPTNQSLFAQLGMDGPSTNLKLLYDVNRDREDRGLPTLLDVRTRSLHSLQCIC